MLVSFQIFRDVSNIHKSVHHIDKLKRQYTVISVYSESLFGCFTKSNILHDKRPKGQGVKKHLDIILKKQSYTQIHA